jgi:hypothetical protein
MAKSFMGGSKDFDESTGSRKTYMGGDKDFNESTGGGKTYMGGDKNFDESAPPPLLLDLGLVNKIM